MNVAAPEKKPAPARWSVEEEARLAASFTGGTAIPEIAISHGRSLGAITARLQLLDLITYGPYSELINAPNDIEEPAANSGQPWTEDATAQLLVAHHTGTPPENLITLAADLGRTPRSLALKLVQLGVITPELNKNPNPAPRTAPKPAKVKAAQKPEAPTRSVKITVTPEFQTALTSIENGENLLILGSAGTGKSTFLKWLRKKLQDKKSYAVLAPTGMAALNVSGQTIHSFFGFKAQLITGSDGWHKPRNPKVFEKLDIAIIDEISMVRADLFDGIERFLRKYGKHPGKPFGGVQLVLMGDLCQLPPVIRRDEAAHFSTLFDSPFFFSSPAWEMGSFGIIEFSHIFRQSDADFIELLNKVRHGNRDWGVVNQLNQRLTKTPPDGAVILAARNRTVEDINQRELAKLTGRAKTYFANTTGDVDPNAFTTPTELTLKPGAHVMFTRNDGALSRWVNGTLGTITECDDNTVTVKLRNGEVHEVEPIKWEITKFKATEADGPLQATVTGTFTQIPLTLAWALTIHKAQGQTLESCVIDLSDGGAFAEGQLYVALSRARSLQGLHLTQPVQQSDIKTAPAVLEFYASLQSAV